MSTLWAPGSRSAHPRRRPACGRSISYPYCSKELEVHRSHAPPTHGADVFVFASAARATELKQNNIRMRVLRAGRRPRERAAQRRRDVRHPCRQGLRPTSSATPSRRSSSPWRSTRAASWTSSGHTNPGFTLRVYRHTMRRHLAARQHLRTLIGYSPRPVCSSCPHLDLPLPRR